MGKTLRYKLANMALCCTLVAVNTIPASAYYIEQDTSGYKMEEVKLGETGTAVTTSSGITILQPAATTTPPAIVVPPEDITVDISILQEESNTSSVAGNFIVCEEIPLRVEDGKYYLTLRFNPVGSMVAQNLRQQIDGEYQSIDLKQVTIGGAKYKEAELVLDTIDDIAYVKCYITAMKGDVTFRVKVNTRQEETKEPVNIKVGYTEDSITVEAQGGSGEYDYTIDGVNWQKENKFTDLAAGDYKVSARDAKDTSNQSEVTLVTLKGKSDNIFEDGEYLVDLKVLKENSNEVSHAAKFVTTTDVPLTVKEGKGYLTLTVTKDPMGIPDAIATVEQMIEGEYHELELKYLGDESVRYVEAEVIFEDLTEAIYLQCGINSPTGIHQTPFRIQIAQNETVEEIVAIKVDTTDTSIAVTATGGSGAYEYSIDGGSSWAKENTYENLLAGEYTVLARDINNISNISKQEVVKLAGPVQNVPEGLENGYYSVDIRVLKEDSDSESMSSQFFNKTSLPLMIVDGKAYLTIQVLKDGMGMTDVITSLEQKTSSGYKSLYLEYLEDSSKRYITSEVEFESISDTVYLRCGIAPVAPMKPVLRVQLIEDSIVPGAGIIDGNFVETMVSSVTAENGQIKIELNQEDDTATKDRFTAVLYKAGESKGEALKLNDFNMQNNEITFSFDEIESQEQEQNYIIGITFEETETKSNTFKVAGLLEQPAGSILKENALEIKYIKGYEDGTFRPDQTVTKAEALHMLAALVEVPEVSSDYQVATIDVLQADKDQTSIAKQFFKTEGIKVVTEEDGYYVEFEITNEGMGFTDIISSFELKTGNKYQDLEVIKSLDLKTSYVRVPVENLTDEIMLRAGIAPMGGVKPDLRIVIKDLQQGELISQYTDIDMWAKNSIILFEQFGVIGEDKASNFNPNTGMTRSEFVKIIAKVMALELTEEDENIYTDTNGHIYEAYINACSRAGYINGFEDGSFQPEKTITRAEIVTLINRVIGHSEETDVEVENNTFKDLKETHWAYKEVMKVADFQ